MEKLVLKNLDEAKAELLKMQQSSHVNAPNWPVYTILCHCAQTIGYSMTGYPKSKPVWIQNTVGKLVFRKFSRQGFMTHNLQAHVPGAPPVEASGAVQEGIAVLLNTIKQFEAWQGELKPHLVFGKLSREAYNHYFAMHIADHLSELTY